MSVTKNLEAQYHQRYEGALVPLARSLYEFIARLDLPSKYHRIGPVTVRPKSIEKFLTKAQTTENEKPKYSDPLHQIQDQLGARIITFYLCDVDPVTKIMKDYFNPIEEIKIVPDSASKFGYEGRHLVLFIPDDILTPEIPRELCPTFFELQVKTLFQYAWSEADHDLAYKPPVKLAPEQEKMVAFTAAQAWGADRIFNRLASELGIIGK